MNNRWPRIACPRDAGPERRGKFNPLRSKGAALAAAYGLHHSSLTVTGNVVVDSGAFVILGCNANPNGTGIPCLDDHAKVPKLRSHTIVTGNVISTAPIGILIHNTAIGGQFKETGGLARDKVGGSGPRRSAGVRQHRDVGGPGRDLSPHPRARQRRRKAEWTVHGLGSDDARRLGPGRLLGLSER